MKTSNVASIELICTSCTVLFVDSKLLVAALLSLAGGSAVQ